LGERPDSMKSRIIPDRFLCSAARTRDLPMPESVSHCYK
jgi:hypothetical protein